MPRVVRAVLILVALGLVIAAVGVWIKNSLRQPVQTPQTEVQVKTLTLDGITFEVEHEMKEGVNLFTSPGPNALYLSRRGDILNFDNGLLTINDIGLPDVKAGDTVRWNLSGPVLVNGQPMLPHAFQPTAIDAESVDYFWQIRESPNPRDTLSVAWIGGTRLFAAAHGDGVIRVWDADKHEFVRSMIPDVPSDPKARGGYGLRISVSPNGKFLAATNLFGEVVSLWDVDKGTKTDSFAEPKGKVAQVAFDGDESFLEARGGKFQRQSIKKLPPFSSIYPVGTVHEQFEAPFAVHPGTGRLAWNDGKKLHFSRSLLEKGLTWEPMSSSGCMAFSAEGSLLAAFNGDNRLSLLDVKTGKESKRLRWRGKLGAADGINALAFSPDGKTLAVGSSDSIRFYDVPTGRERGGLGSPWVRSLAYSADGRTLVAVLKYQPGLRQWNTTDLIAK